MVTTERDIQYCAVVPLVSEMSFTYMSSRPDIQIIRFTKKNVYMEDIHFMRELILLIVCSRLHNIRAVVLNW